MPLQRNIITVHKRIYYTERLGTEIDGERYKYAKEGYNYVISSLSKKRNSGEAGNASSFYISFIVNALPFEEINIKIGDQVILNGKETYYVTYIDDSNYRNIIVEARS